MRRFGFSLVIVLAGVALFLGGIFWPATNHVEAQGAAIANCDDTTTIAFPLPQTSDGEYLFVSCLRITGSTSATYAYVTLARAIEGRSSWITSDELASVYTDPQDITVWVKGSLPSNGWFRLDSLTYTAVNQTYGFEVASGTYTYGFFYSNLPRPVGSQYSLASTTETGNVIEDMGELAVRNEPPRAILVSTGILLLAGGLSFHTIRRKLLAVEQIA